MSYVCMYVCVCIKLGFYAFSHQLTIQAIVPIISMCIGSYCDNTQTKPLIDYCNLNRFSFSLKII